jgi:hypothetical protein
MTGFILPTPRQPVTQSSPDTSKPAPDTAPPTPAVRRALSSARAGDLKALGAKDAPPEEDKSSASANAQRRQPLSAVLADLNKPRKGPPTSASLPASRAAIVPVKQSDAAAICRVGTQSSAGCPTAKTAKRHSRCALGFDKKYWQRAANFCQFTRITGRCCFSRAKHSHAAGTCRAGTKSSVECLAAEAAKRHERSDLEFCKKYWL